MNTKPVAIIKFSAWAKYYIFILLIFNDMCGGTNCDWLAPSEVYKLSIIQSRILIDHVTLRNSFVGIWIISNLGEVVAEG